jgi:RNA polymerase sigma factor (sigma-70 family)
MTVAGVGLRGDEDELFARYAARLARIVARQVRTSNANVEDACAFAWLQMLRYQPARETLLSWLVRTGTREAVKLHRQAERDLEPVDEVTDREGVQQTVEVCLDLLIARETLAAARLRPREAEILAAHASGFTYAEIAVQGGVTPRTVERQLLRARRKVRAAREGQRPAIRTRTRSSPTA